VGVWIIAVVVDQGPRRTAILEHAKNIFESGGGIGPVIRRFHGNRVREKIGCQGFG